MTVPNGSKVFLTNPSNNTFIYPATISSAIFVGSRMLSDIINDTGITVEPATYLKSYYYPKGSTNKSTVNLIGLVSKSYNNVDIAIGENASGISFLNNGPITLNGNILMNTKSSTIGTVQVLNADSTAVTVGSKSLPTIINSSVAPKIALPNGNTYTIYHSGNKPSASDIDALPISGGTVNGPLTVNSIMYMSNDSGIVTKMKDGTSTRLIWMSNTDTVSVGQTRCQTNINSLDNPKVVLPSGTYNIYHSGNKPKELSSSGNRTADSGLNVTSNDGLSMNTIYSNDYPCMYGNLLNLNGRGKSELAMEWSGNAVPTTGRLYYRSKRDADGTGWSNWKKIAYTDDTVSGSYTLAPCVVSADTSTDNINKYFKLMTINILEDYGSFSGDYNVGFWGHGMEESAHHKIGVWVKRQNNNIFMDVKSWGNSDSRFASYILVQTGQYQVTLYAFLRIQYCRLYMSCIGKNYSNASFQYYNEVSPINSVGDINSSEKIMDKPATNSSTGDTTSYMPITGGSFTGITGVTSTTPRVFSSIGSSFSTLCCDSNGTVIGGANSSNTSAALAYYLRINKSNLTFNNGSSSYTVYHTGNLSPLTTSGGTLASGASLKGKSGSYTYNVLSIDSSYNTTIGDQDKQLAINSKDIPTLNGNNLFAGMYKVLFSGLVTWSISSGHASNSASITDSVTYNPDNMVYIDTDGYLAMSFTKGYYKISGHVNIENNSSDDKRIQFTLSGTKGYVDSGSVSSFVDEIVPAGKIKEISFNYIFAISSSNYIEYITNNSQNSDKKLFISGFKMSIEKIIQ